MHPAAYNLTPPSRQRKGIWLGGIIQIMVTRACDESCHHCSQGSNLGGKVQFMTPEEFEQAVDSLEGFWGIRGLFGGNPCMSIYFEDYCRILRAKVPFHMRGLWSNSLRGKGAHARITFDPSHSNLNTHLSREAYDEFARDWPECVPYLKGLDTDSVHGAPFVAIKDVIADEDQMWQMIGDCDVSRWWSACIGIVPGRGLRAYFCELAYSQASNHASSPDADDWPDTGMVPIKDWWKAPIEAYKAQIRQHCPACGIPLRRPGIPAITGTHEEFSATHAAIARPKTKGRPVELVTIGGPVERPDRPATQYLSGVTPGYRD